MNHFTQLFQSVDSVSGTNQRIRYLREYFEESKPEDSIWACWFLDGNRVKNLIRLKDLKILVADVCSLPLWLVEDSHEVVGDLAETLSLLLKSFAKGKEPIPLSTVVEKFILPLSSMNVEEKCRTIKDAWARLRPEDLLPYHKLMMGAFRMGISNGNLCRALGDINNVPPAIIAQRMMGKWQPGDRTLQNIIVSATTEEDLNAPVPFCLASPLMAKVNTLGDNAEWQIEWKWDGIRAQLIKSHSGTLIWSRGGESVGGAFPEILEAAKLLPKGVCLDGEILAWNQNGLMPFHDLQRRLGRKSPGVQIQRTVPTRFIAYDIIRFAGEDLRNKVLVKRRHLLEQLVTSLPSQYPIGISRPVEAGNWEEYQILRDESREKGVEGFMLKHIESRYNPGRKKGGWYKWKIAPLEADMVLVGAQMGHGRRANIFSDYSLAVWHKDELVVVAKAYSGLTDNEILKVDKQIRKTIIGKFGPVRSVKPMIVFQVAFEGVQRSRRRKTGVGLRFPRIQRWRQDKLPEEAGHLDEIMALGQLQNLESPGQVVYQPELDFKTEP
ncbi:MAG: ATP-dependent DNA ligase [Opitutae bacterium]|nr:ATP-dependent DNA ligase [Opitutae bacterium]